MHCVGLTDSDHEQLAGPCHVDHSVGVLEDLNHHLLLILWWGSVLGMRAGMDDTIHIQIQVVGLFAVWVGTGGINRNDRAIFHRHRLFLDHGGYDLGVFGGKPSEGGGNTHLVEGGRLYCLSQKEQYLDRYWVRWYGCAGSRLSRRATNNRQASSREAAAQGDAMCEGQASCWFREVDRDRGQGLGNSCLQFIMISLQYPQSTRHNCRLREVGNSSLAKQSARQFK